MTLLCTKTIEPYWGVAFKEGKIYKSDVSENRNTTLIIDEDNYWKYTKLIIQSRDFPDYKQEEMYKVIPGYLTHKQINDSFCKTFEAEYITLTGDDNMRSTFCLSKRKDLIETYGSCKFVHH